MSTSTTNALKAEWGGIAVIEWWHKDRIIAAISPWYKGGVQVETMETDGFVTATCNLGSIMGIEDARRLLVRHGYIAEATKTS